MVRLGVAIVGAGLVISGINRRSIVGTGMALAGTWLLYRAIRSGRSRQKQEPTSETEATEQERASASAGITIRRAITIDADTSDVISYLRDPEEMDRLVGDAIEVSYSGGDRQRWALSAPLGRQLSWELRVVEDPGGEHLRWESLDVPLLAADGAATFRQAPGDRGTEVTLELRVVPIGGRLLTPVLERLGIVPSALAGTVLDRLKRLAETGETDPRTANPSARGRGDLV